MAVAALRHVRVPTRIRLSRRPDMIFIHRTPRWLVASAVALTGALLPEVAAAQQKAPPPDRSPQALFARLDIDADGKLSKEEVTRMPSVATRWEMLDKNNDGALSREEFIAGFRT
jgi:hypothetical protein